MSAPPVDPIEAHVAALARAVRGPSTVRRSVLREARDGLDDAADAYRRAGIDDARAARLAVRDFGSIAEVAPLYQRELVAGAGRRTALLLATGIPAVRLSWSLLLAGQPAAGPPAPRIMDVFTTVQDVAVALAATSALVLVVLGARSAASTRLVAAATAITAIVAVAVIGGAAVAMNVVQAGQTWGRLLVQPAGLLICLVSVVMVVAVNRSAAVTLCTLRPRTG
jgi:hypothetical protein